MNAENTNKPHRPSPYSYTWILKQKVEHLTQKVEHLTQKVEHTKDQVTAIIETIKLVNNKGYENTLNERLEVANEKNKERLEVAKKKKRKRGMKNESKDSRQEDNAGGGEAAGDQPASENQQNAARRFQF